MSGIKIGNMFLAVLIAVSMLGYLGIASAAVTSNANGALSIMNLKISPTPVVSGGNVTLSFNLYNSYTSSLDNVDLGLVSSNPIINVSPAYSYVTQAIGQGMYNGFINPFVFKLHVPSTLPQGLYVINVTATYQTSQSGEDVAGSSIMPIFIYVYGNPNIGVNIAPETNVVPGQPFNAELSLVNYGTGMAYNTTAYISNSSFVPVGQGRVIFGNVGEGESGSAQISLEALQNITSGTNLVNLTLKYQTGTNQNITKAVSVPMSIVLNRPRIAVSVLSANPTQLYAGSNQSITMMVQNIGTGIAKNVTVHLIGSNSLFPSSSATSFFIGALGPGNTTTEVFTVDANSGGVTNSSFPIYTSYYSSNYMDKYNSTLELPINVAPTSVFQIEAVKSNGTVGGTYQPITFTVKNTGNEDAEQISFTLQTIYPITPADSTYYIDNMSPGQTRNVTFYINTAQNGAAGEYSATVYEQWRQPNGNSDQQYSGSSPYYIPVSATAKKNSGSLGDIVELIIVVAVVVFGYRFYTKRMKQKKGKEVQKREEKEKEKKGR